MWELDAYAEQGRARYLPAMDLSRIEEIADELQELADADKASFGLYREAHEEDVFARATSDGVVALAAELLAGLKRIDNPVGNSLIALDGDSSFHDANADLNFHAVEIYGDDLAPPRKRKLRISRQEYAAMIGCLFTLVVTTICALFGVYVIGSYIYRYFVV